MTDGKVSIIIPAGNEQFLNKTVDDVFNKATGDIEVIVALDGCWPNPPLDDRKGLKIIHFGSNVGMRSCLNAAAEIATGKYLLKTDAHCLFAEGFDEALKADCDDAWIVIPRRYSLDAENWVIEKNGKGPRDYHFISSPIWSKRERQDYSMHGLEWPERSRERRDKPEYDIDDNPSFQGSCWFMHTEHFKKRLGGMSEEGYGTFAQEPQEIGNKTWLGNWDGRVVVNKRTWYAHLHKGKRYKHLWKIYPITPKEIAEGHEYSANYWMQNRWQERKHDLEWLIDKFWPMPTWDDDWKEVTYGKR